MRLPADSVSASQGYTGKCRLRIEAPTLTHTQLRRITHGKLFVSERVDKMAIHSPCLLPTSVPLEAQVTYCLPWNFHCPTVSLDSLEMVAMLQTLTSVTSTPSTAFHCPISALCFYCVAVFHR